MHLGISHVSLRRAALFGWPSVGVIQLFRCATCRESNRLAAQGHPSRRPTTGQDAWESEHHPENQSRTAGALAQGTALHSGAKMGKSSVASRAASSQRRWA